VHWDASLGFHSREQNAGAQHARSIGSAAQTGCSANTARICCSLGGETCLDYQAPAPAGSAISGAPLEAAGR
jgi:hypothetical protein